jgi:hypothetical protein
MRWNSKNRKAGEFMNLESKTSKGETKDEQ